jgi:hypothetical protein
MREHGGVGEEGDGKEKEAAAHGQERVAVVMCTARAVSVFQEHWMSEDSWKWSVDYYRLYMVRCRVV